jgi:tRNA threonylcarbamoyladenosine biosynthesis protein TsaB
MKILAVDTATERCSVALHASERWFERSVDTPRGHAEIVLPMIQEVLREANVALEDLDGIAYGRGPGAFTGVRIAVGVVQGLAFGAGVPTIGISDLAAVAQQVAVPGARILVCMDARMREVYWGVFEAAADGHVVAVCEERVTAPDAVSAESITHAAGTGFSAYPQLAARWPTAQLASGVLPRAREVALLAAAPLGDGRGEPAAQARPVYLRDRVTFVKEVP